MTKQLQGKCLVWRISIDEDEDEDAVKK